MRKGISGGHCYTCPTILTHATTTCVQLFLKIANVICFGAARGPLTKYDPVKLAARPCNTSFDEVRLRALLGVAWWCRSTQLHRFLQCFDCGHRAVLHR